MNRLRRTVGVLAGLMLLASPGAWGAGAEAQVRIPFAASGPGASLTLEAAVYRPDGDRRFPVAVLSHGSPRDANQRKTMRPDFNTLRAWLVDQGYAVVVPMRRGFGDSDGTYVEGYGQCADADYVAAGRAAADDVDAAVRYVREQPYADAGRIVLFGHSAGGFASLAEASRNHDGVIAVVSFAGGKGSARPDFVCSPEREIDAMKVFGTTTRVPTLWIYAANDHFFGPAFARQMFDAFVAGGAPRAEFFAAPAAGGDGHMFIFLDPAAWKPVVAGFLQKLARGDHRPASAAAGYVP